jgi:hypothetical protein
MADLLLLVSLLCCIYVSRAREQEGHNVALTQPLNDVQVARLARGFDFLARGHETQLSVDVNNVLSTGDGC